MTSLERRLLAVERALLETSEVPPGSDGVVAPADDAQAGAAAVAAAEQRLLGSPALEEVIRRLAMEAVGGGTRSGSYDKTFVALAREVKSLKEKVESGAGGGAQGGQDAALILATSEFKAAFDAKINQVLAYVKGDVVPKAVRDALAQRA